MSTILETGCPTPGCPRKGRPEYAPHCKECGVRLRAAAEAAAKEKAREYGRCVKITDYRKLEQQLEVHGFHIEHSAHFKIKNANGCTISTLARTPSDHRSLLNVISDIRRETGIDIRKEKGGG